MILDRPNPYFSEGVGGARLYFAMHYGMMGVVSPKFISINTD